MADSAFWRDLTAQFLELQDSLHTDGKVTKLWRKRFEVLAMRGASAIALPDTPTDNLLFFWLKAVRKEDPAFRSSYLDKEAFSVAEDERLAEYEQNLEMGYFDGLCQASATFCQRLEARAVQTEFEEKHRNAAETRTTSYRSEVTGNRKGSASRPQRRHVDARKELIARLKARNPNASARKICELIDQTINKEAPIRQGNLAPLEPWRKLAPGARTWVDFYDAPKTRNRVRTYVNKVPALQTGTKSSK